MSQPAFANGKICNVEIASDNIQNAATFYKDVFGWLIKNDNSGNITFDDTVGQVSGMWVTNRKPASAPGFIISIMVNSIAETVELITDKAGGITDVNLDGLEKMARFTDPSGNVFGRYQHQM